MFEQDANQFALKTYPGPWKGQLLLVCRKCQKKLKQDGKKHRLANIKKLIKKQSRHDEAAVQLHVLEVSCLKMCPKGGVTVSTQAQLARGECCIVRTKSDVKLLMANCTAGAASQMTQLNSGPFIT